MSQRQGSILFKGPLFEKVLDGSKFQTRRIAKAFQDQVGDWAGAVHPTGNKDGWIGWWPGRVTAEQTAEAYPSGGVPCPYGTTGDWLHCGEPLVPLERGGLFFASYARDGALVADSRGLAVEWRWNLKDDKPQRLKSGEWWKLSSMFTPLEYRRVWLELVRSWPERLHDISVEDIKAEGVLLPVRDNGDGTATPCYRTGTRRSYDPGKPFAEWTVDDLWRHEWAHLWDSVNRKGPPWSANAWLWCLEFKLLSTTGRPSA